MGTRQITNGRGDYKGFETNHSMLTSYDLTI